MSPDWDVAVVGAGPAGATAAALLAGAGAKTVLLEREEFPRFHIGESLLPFGLPVHERIGLELDEEVALFKRGAQFVCESTDRVARFDFSEALPGPPRHAWHVDRSLFDARVMACAVRAGAELRYARVSEVEFFADRVDVVAAGERLGARYLLDATGQGRLMAKREKAVRPFHHFGKAAVFAHYDGLGDDGMAAIGEGNDIRIVMVPDGWAWVIPLPGRRLSVGLVSRLKGLTNDAFDAFVSTSPLITRMTQGATRSELRTVGNFSFRNSRSSGARYACIGDSACFIDPVFSSGVCLGMNGAAMAVDQLLPALAAGTEGIAELMDPVQAKLRSAYDTFCAMVYRFYNTRFVDNMIFGAPDEGDLKAAVTSVLGGDIWRQDNRFRDMLLRARAQPWQDAGSVSHPA